MEVRTYERLSAQDASFVMFEHRATPMHVAAVAIFEGGPLAAADGSLDAGRLAKHVASRLHRLPRYRKRLVFTPLERHPIWVDDARFDLAWHLRRAALPRPASESALRELVGRILSQPLERSRPLWELWAIEGLEDGRFALVSKVHHCMVDGVSGANLLTLLFSASPDEAEQAVPDWRPLPPPGAYELALDEGIRRLGLGGGLVRGAAAALRAPRAALGALARVGGSVADAITSGLGRPVATPLNGPIGPHRRVAWHSLDLAAAKAVKARLGGTVNDVVLAVVAGALHRFFAARVAWPARFDYRVVVPVNMRTDAGESAANHVSAIFLSLPVAEPDPLARYARVRAATERLKASRVAKGIEWFARLADQLGPTWLTLLGVRLVTRLHPYNLIVTNVPGPQFPLYVLGARLQELYPHLPLFEHQGLGVAVLSYDGRIGFGLVADWELVPDLERLAEAIAGSFAELEAASESAGGRRSSRKKAASSARPPSPDFR